MADILFETKIQKILDYCREITERGNYVPLYERHYEKLLKKRGNR